MKAEKADIAKLVGDALDKMYGRQTDLVFLTIENSPELLKRYKAAVAEHGWKTANNRIAKYVKKSCGGKSAEREYEPMSILMQSFTRFK